MVTPEPDGVGMVVIEGEHAGVVGTVLVVIAIEIVEIVAELDGVVDLAALLGF